MATTASASARWHTIWRTLQLPSGLEIELRAGGAGGGDGQQLRAAAESFEQICEFGHDQ